MSRLRFISFFAGIGGGDLGMEMAGHRCVGQLENNDSCRKVLAAHWPAAQRFCDVTQTFPSFLADADVYLVSDPCQRNSLANSRITDGRTPPGLWQAAYRFAAERKPQFVVRENPTRIFRDAPTPPELVAEDLERMGYVCTIIDMQCGQVSSVSRQRTFVCAGIGPAGERLRKLLAEHQCSKGDWPKIGSQAIPLAALTCHPYRYDNRDNFIAYGDGRIRVLSRAERLRAQGFPRTWLDCLENPALMTVAKLTGNAWPTFAARWIGERLAGAAGRRE